MNLTFDLETLGNTSSAPISQIGAVVFTNKGEIVDKFLATINIKSLQKYGFYIDFDTLSWWLNQEMNTIRSVYGDNLEKISLSEALSEFRKFYNKYKIERVWSHTTFDPPILNNAFIKLDQFNPMPFRLHRDIRTLTDLKGHEKIERKGVHHNALDDCIYQAEYISKLLNK